MYASTPPKEDVPSRTTPRRMFSADLREVLPPVIAEVIRDGLPLMDKRWGGKFLSACDLWVDLWGNLLGLES